MNESPLVVSARTRGSLVFDEPADPLDLQSIERFEDALAAYPGAIVLVTHDDHLTARCTTTTWWVAEGRVAV